MHRGQANRALRALAAITLLSFLCIFQVAGAPAGMTVQSGTATRSQQGDQLNITASHNAVLNWSSFNLAPNETATFLQPSASSVVWNRIFDSEPSQIWGNLNANGVVVLMNQSGFFFGPNAFVSAAGLIVSTPVVTPVESGGGLFWRFGGAPPQASIINYGQIHAGPAGSLFLIAERIENHGTLHAPKGQVGLLAGREVLLADRPDGRGFSATVRLPSGSVDNSGRITADAGTIAMQAQVVNQNGFVQADSIREQNGVIELFAADSVTLGDHSLISAQGDTGFPSDGGKIKIKSEGTFTDSASSRLTVAGSEQGGNGGVVEISAPIMPEIRSQVAGQAGAGGVGGRLLIDPQDILVGNAGNDRTSSGSVPAADPPAVGALNLNVDAAFIGFSQINLQATRDITIASGVTWDLVASTGRSDPGCWLRLEAGNNITIADNASLLAGENWSVTLEAGRDFTTPGLVRPGIGNVTFSGSGALQAENGNINLIAGDSITVNGGHVRTTGGGDITARAVSGSIHSGTKDHGFLFLPAGYLVSPDLGGISTANGGDVNLRAGLDVTSHLPIAGNLQTDAGSGAFGPAPGNVSISAGRDVSGHFVVRNGAGTITAGRDAGTPARLLALSLVDGGWTVDAVRDICLQEVRNPNGVFNNLGFGSSPTRQRFDYSPDAFTTLRAGNGVQLRGTALPRYADLFSQGLTPIYPGTLDITAGAGGVSLGNEVTLFPSPLGNLRITTTDGGSLFNTKPGGALANLVVSDSAKIQYRQAGDFGIADHGAALLHLNDPEPVRLDIAGDMTGILLGVPKRAEITVGGNMVNSRFDGQNLHAGEITSLHVAGDILNRNEFTSITVASAPDFTLLDLAYPPLAGSLAGLASQLHYEPATRKLTFQGRMDGSQLEVLKNLSVRAFDANGLPIREANGEPVTRIVHLLNPTEAEALYAQSQDVPSNPNTGYRIGGGGALEITARNLDLGATAGIVSQGPRANPALAGQFTRGADIQVFLSGKLDMFSTTVSSLNGGDLLVVVGGSATIGSADFAGNDAAARGIFTTDASDVTVIARGNIGLHGSRIAAYDGGNIIVRSLEGNVDAGIGGLGSVAVEKIYVDPLTRAIQTYIPTIPGSGILATTFPPSQDPAFPRSVNRVGDILVETPRGDILASAGGVVQIPLNGLGFELGTVTLHAGTTGPDGEVAFRGNIDTTGSGVVGGTVFLKASGDIQGVVVARANLDIIARQSANVTALAQGNVNISSGGVISGTVIGIGGVSASGANVDAAILSQNIADGTVSSGQVGFSQGTAANNVSRSQQMEAPDKLVATPEKAGEEEWKRKSAARPRVTRTTGRVTIIAPAF